MVLESKILAPEELSILIDKEIFNISLPKSPENLYLPIKHILESGGKRIRPILVLAACNLFSEDIEQAVYPAIAVEVFHNFTLVHDDIMDNAQVRRGVETVHRKWNTNVAILSGDAMSILAYNFLSKANERFFSKIVKVFNEFSLSICEGQQMDMDFEKQSSVTIDEYLRMIELKTSVLIKGALEIGAIIGGANELQTSLIGSFGLNLGLAFQLQDDLLDLYSNPDFFGKRMGGDVLARKKTILYLNALNKSNEKEKMESFYNSENLDPEFKVTEAINKFNALNVREITEEQISNYYKNAIKFLEEIDISPDRKTTLLAIAKNIMKRER